MSGPANIDGRLVAALAGAGFEKVLRQAPAAVFIKDLDGRYRFVNRAWEAIAGIAGERAIGLDDEAIFGAEAARAFTANDRQVLATGVSLEVEEGGELRGGRRTYRSFKFPVRDADGTVVGIGGIAVEITRARQVEEALREGEERLRRALLGAAWPVMVHDRGGRILLVNQAWLDGAGLAADEIPDVATWLRRAHGDDGARLERLIRETIDSDRRAVGMEMEVRTPTGVRIWNFVGSPLGEIGGVPAMVSMAVDITDRKRAEDELRRREEELNRIFMTSPDLLGIADFDGYYRRINPAYSATLGFPEEKFLSRPHLECVHPDDREHARDAIRCLEQGHTVSRFVIRCLHADGGTRWVAWNGSAVPGTTLYVLVGRDVTREKERADFEQQLIGIVSHDLKNPLSAIRLAATALLRRGDSLDERTLRAAGRIQSSADSALKLTHDLLDFTRARLGGAIPVHPEPVDVHRLVREAADEVQAAFPDRHVELRQSGPGDGEWDPGRLAQVVKNLLVNALKYSPPDSPVRVCSRGVDAGAVEFDVQNEGPPIPAEELPHLFEPMRRGRGVDGQGVDGQGGGVGLGLFIVDRLVQAHGGRVSATSSAEAGTKFVVRLPRRSSPTA
jgi:PAS domain S-box-containing protein